MDVWEHRTPELRRYFYHVSSGRKLIVRWDNTPHFKDISIFPHHKHINKRVEESKEMTAQPVLDELKKMKREHLKDLILHKMDYGSCVRYRHVNRLVLLTFILRSLVWHVSGWGKALNVLRVWHDKVQ